MPLVLTEKTGINLAVDGGNLDISADAADILTLIKTVDGAASGLDADLLDGLHGSSYATAAQGALADTSLQPADAADFATAAQGALADSALQTGDIVTVAVGDVSSPGLSFTGDLNSGLYRPTNDVVAVATGGVERARFSSLGISIDGGASGIFEQGTFAPEYAPTSGSFTTLTYSTNVGQYIRLGGWVIASGQIATSSVTVGTASGDLRITGLPFAISQDTNVPAVAATYMRGFGSSWASSSLLSVNSTDFTIDVAGTNATSAFIVQVSNLTTGATAFRNVLRFTVAYRHSA